MTKPRICVVGSINVDIVVRAERLPSPGETLTGSSCAIVLGGKGANQAVAAAKLGADVLLIGKVGNDSFGAFARGDLARFGIDQKGILQSNVEETGIAAIGIDANGQNAITIVAGANGALAPSDLTPFGEDIRNCDVLLLQCEIPPATNLAAARLAKQGDAIVILDPAPVPPEGVAEELLALCDVVTPNETETSLMTGLALESPNFVGDAGGRLLGLGVKTAVIKLGANGACAVSAAEIIKVPAFKVTVVDTVAAGDTFNAAYAVARAERIDGAPALKFASAAAAIAVTRPGAAAASPQRHEVERLLTVE